MSTAGEPTRLGRRRGAPPGRPGSSPEPAGGRRDAPRGRRGARASLWAGAALLALVVCLAVLAPLLTPYSPRATRIAPALLPPGSPHHLLGTDHLGRDELARVLYGGRVSLLVGFAAAVIVTVVGTVIGVTWAFLRGPASHAVSAVVDALLALPLLVVVLGFQAVVRPGTAGVVLAIGLTGWMPVARMARARTSVVRVEPYVRVARQLGARRRDTFVHHLLPAVAPAVLSVSMFEVAGAILTESTLSFLGLGVPSSQATWGNMLTSSQDDLLGGDWWLVVPPAAGIVLTVAAVSLVIGVRDSAARRGGESGKGEPR
ncbi:ABC transporter permease [Streptomyces sp. NPDC047002]|uniref:ABC transporter permease n=1 Tax=Streptomyces sp. NPDC047002 TaxID=3155475 RepID=UPI003454BF5D